MGWLSVTDQNYGCELINYSDFRTPQYLIKINTKFLKYVDTQASYDTKNKLCEKNAKSKRDRIKI